MNREIELIKVIAKKRRISLLELHTKGYWVIQNEINLTKLEQL